MNAVKIVRRKPSGNPPKVSFSPARVSFLMWVLAISMMTSCSIIGDIFQAGIGVGVFLTVVVIVGVVFLIIRGGKK